MTRKKNIDRNEFVKEASDQGHRVRTSIVNLNDGYCTRCGAEFELVASKVKGKDLRTRKCGGVGTF